MKAEALGHAAEFHLRHRKITAMPRKISLDRTFIQTVQMAPPYAKVYSKTSKIFTTEDLHKFVQLCISAKIFFSLQHRRKFPLAQRHGEENFIMSEGLETTQVH